MRVDIWSVVCPWCYVGTARFTKALADFGPKDRVEVVYRSFELDPNWPVGQTMPILGQTGQQVPAVGGRGPGGRAGDPALGGTASARNARARSR